MGGDQKKHQHNGKTGEAGEGNLREDEGEIRGAAGGGGKPRMKVAVIGDFMVDRYLIGDVTRISPEAPIPVVKIKEQFDLPGGAGNVAENLKALGVEEARYKDSWHIPVKNRLMVGDHQLARWDQDDQCEPIKYGVKFLECDAVIVADYGKGAISPYIIEEIKKFDGPIFVDTKGDPSCWSGVATAIFPNSKEYVQYQEQYDKFDGIVVLKDGSRGLFILDDVNGDIESPAQARFIRSVNGAGDTVIAAFVYKYLTIPALTPFNEFWQDCLDFANAAAAVACEHPYTYAPTLKEVEDRYYGM